MKNKIHYYIAFIVIATLFASTGCKKTPKPGTGLFGLHLHTYIGDSLISPGNLNVFLPDSNGRVTKLSHAQFYMSNISLHSTTSGWYIIPNSLILMREENEEYVIGNIPADTYDDVRFTVGIPALLNASAPSSFTCTNCADTVLSTSEQSAMWFGAGNGYKFMSLAGWVDSLQNDTTHLIPFSYDIGNTPDTVLVTMPIEAFTLQPTTVIPNVQFVHIVCDYGHLIKNVNINGDASQRIGNSYGSTSQTEVARYVWSFIKTMFRYECSTPNGTC